MRRIPWKTILRFIAAGVFGYAVVTTLTSLGFNVWLDGADLYRGGPILQIQGTLVALVSGLAGGAIAGSVGRIGRSEPDDRPRPVLHALAVLPLLIVDTAYVLFVFEGTAPWWFDLGGSLVLITATVAGGWLAGAAGVVTRSQAPPGPT